MVKKSCGELKGWEEPRRNLSHSLTHSHASKGNKKANKKLSLAILLDLLFLHLLLSLSLSLSLSLLISEGRLGISEVGFLSRFIIEDSQGPFAGKSDRTVYDFWYLKQVVFVGEMLQ